MAEVRITLEGLPQTVAVLQTLADKIGRRCLTKATTAGVGPFVRAARRIAPRATGLFARSVQSKVKYYRAGQVAIGIAGQTRRVANRRKLRQGRGGISGRGLVVPIHLIEEPTMGHEIAAPIWRSATRKLSSALRWSHGGTQYYARRVRHPGTRGQHVIRRAADAAAGEAAAKFADKLAVEVAREAGK